MRIDCRTGAVHTVSAGQGPILVYRRATDEFTSLGADMPPMGVFALPYAGGFIVVLAALVIRQPAVGLTGSQALTLLYLGGVASGLGFFLWNQGAARVNAGMLAVMNNAKVPLGIAVSLLFFGEHAYPPAVIASLALLVAAAVLAHRD